MGAIFGIFSRLEKTDLSSQLSRMANAFNCGGAVGASLWSGPFGGVGRISAHYTPESVHLHAQLFDSLSGVAFTCSGRLDNRQDLARTLQIPARELLTLADEDLIRCAYHEWGENCVERLYGDWSFAVWNAETQRLFLARDHFGLTSLYYYEDKNIFAFASDRKAISTLQLFAPEMDELYLAQLVTCWSDYEGERTVCKQLRRLPPAHVLSLAAQKLSVRQYWHLEQAAEVHFPCRDDYVERFNELFNHAIDVRLRAPLQSDGTPAAIASTLSGGLDSSAVTATAAFLLKSLNRRISAYTSVPLADTAAYTNGRFGDEFPLAESTVRYAGNIDHYPISAAAITPLQAIRAMLDICGEPLHAAGNFYWMLDLWGAVRLSGCKVLLIGQFGNAGVSWKGAVSSQPVTFQIQRLGLLRWLKEQLKRTVSPQLLKSLRYCRVDKQQSYRETAINPAFAERLKLHELRFSDQNELIARRDPRGMRSFIGAGKTPLGALHAEMGAAFNIDVRDPTADPRLLAFTFAVPDRIFIDPQTGLDRWLIREAMKGVVPDEVRLNRNRGRQAGDLVPRLRASAAEVNAALDELAAGPAAEYVDLLHMRAVWAAIQRDDSSEAFGNAIAILTRGIMAGLFVNRFYKGK